MRLWRILAAVPVALLLVGCSDSVRTSEVTIGTPDPLYQPDEVAQLEAEAAGGDLSAARSLAVHYGGIEDVAAQRRWLRFAAERGDCDMLQVLYEDVTVLSGPPDEKAATELEKLAASVNCRKPIRIEARG